MNDSIRWTEDDIKLVNVDKAKENLLKSLMSLYLHDISEFADDLEVNEEGMYEYEGIELYFSKAELNPFLIYCNDKIAGFLLLNSGKYVPKGIDYSIHEIFILKSYRGKGVANSAIKKIFHEYKGKYKVEQLQNNKLAVDFWKRFYEKQNITYEEEVEVIDGFNGCTQVFAV